MFESVKMSRKQNPFCKLPENLDTPAWRYMDMDKFQSLLNKKALYLTRADRLGERFEGTYSCNQISEMNNYLTRNDHSQVIETEREHRRMDRLRTYISCWCMSDCDLDLMWKAYVRNRPGVAIKSSVRRLVNICDKADDHHDISKVEYFDHMGGEPINYFGTPTTFIYKDIHFRLDNELRIIHSPNFPEPTPDHVLLPIDLIDLIEKVVLQPATTESSLETVREALNKVGLNEIPVLPSRDDRKLIE